MRRVLVRAFRLHVRGIAKSKPRPRLAAGRPPLRKGSEVSRKKVVKFVHEFVEDFVEDIVVHRRQLVTASCIDAAVG